tara:strand:+ start:828 stop:1112 length:285 start_codon:yes stop_codon:yes gene_type:complete
MTTTSRRKRKTTTPIPVKLMTVETNKKPDVDLIPLGKYKEDFVNRMARNNYEIRELYKDSKWLEDKVRPRVVTFVANIKPNFDKLVDQVKQAAP